MAQELLPLANPPPPRRRGRPPGARNRRSLDLARYIEATFSGMTPGQQSAELAMVKPKDLKAGRDLAKELRLVDLDLSPMMLAMAVKAAQLAAALGCERKEAWELLRREREGLMKYVHQVQPAAKEPGKSTLATVFLVPEGEAADASIGELPDDMDQDPDFAGELPGLARQVAQPKSHDAT